MAAAAPSPIIPMPGQEKLQINDLAVVATGQYGFNDGPAASAMFQSNISAMLRLQDGSVLVADDFNHRIRVLSADLLKVSTVAGDGEMGYRDGAAAQAQFRSPHAFTLLSDGRVLVADWGNHRIRMLSADLQQVSTVAGDGGHGHRDGAAAQAQFRSPHAFALLSDGRVLVADWGNHRIRMLSADLQQVIPVAGDGGHGHRDGAAAQAQLDHPAGLALLYDGRVLVADQGNHRIRMLSADLQQVIPVAGDGGHGHRDGAAAQAQFYYPFSLKHLEDGRVLLVDVNAAQCTIRILNADLQQVSTLTEFDTLNSVSALELLEGGRILVANHGRIHVLEGLVSEFGPKSGANAREGLVSEFGPKSGGNARCKHHPFFCRLRF
jgi:hypothetical protein